MVMFFMGHPLWWEDGSVFVYAAGPCQRSLSRVRVTWDSWPYFTVSDLRLPFSSSVSQSHIATDNQSVSKSWCRAPSGTHDQIFIAVRQLRSCFCGAPSLTRGPCQRSPRIQVPWDSRSYFTVSDLRLPISLPPTTHRVTVEVFDPASTRGSITLTTAHIRHGPRRKHHFPARALERWLLPSNGCCLVCFTVVA
jgi:hypothetical protein